MSSPTLLDKRPFLGPNTWLISKELSLIAFYYIIYNKISFFRSFIVMSFGFICIKIH